MLACHPFRTCPMADAFALTPPVAANADRALRAGMRHLLEVTAAALLLAGCCLLYTSDAADE